MFQHRKRHGYRLLVLISYKFPQQPFDTEKVSILRGCTAEIYMPLSDLFPVGLDYKVCFVIVLVYNNLAFIRGPVALAVKHIQQFFLLHSAIPFAKNCGAIADDTESPDKCPCVGN